MSEERKRVESDRPLKRIRLSDKILINKEMTTNTNSNEDMKLKGN